MIIIISLKLQLQFKMTSEIDRIRAELKRVRTERTRAEERHERKRRSAEKSLNKLSTAVAGHLKRRLNPIYDEAMQEVMGPMYPRPAAQLLELSHMCENADKLLDMTVAQWRHQSDYLVCEITVLKQETADIKEEYAKKSAEILEQINQIAAKVNNSASPIIMNPLQIPRLNQSSFSSWSLRKPSRRSSTFSKDDDDNNSICSNKTFKTASTYETHQVSLVDEDDDDAIIVTSSQEPSTRAQRNTSCVFSVAPLIEHEELELIDF